MIEKELESTLYNLYIRGGSDVCDNICAGMQKTIDKIGDRALQISTVIAIIKELKKEFVECHRQLRDKTATSDLVMEDIKAGRGLKPIRNPLTEVKIAKVTTHISPSDNPCERLFDWVRRVLGK